MPNLTPRATPSAAKRGALLRRVVPADAIRIIVNLVSVAAGQAGLIVAQALFVGIGTRALGVDAFGQWLIVSAVPAYLAMADLGLVVSTSNGIQRQVTLGKSRDAQGRLSAALGLIWGLAILMLVPGVAALLLLSDPITSTLTAFTANGLLLLFGLFLFDFATSTSASLFVAVLRAHDRFASAQLLFNALKVAQVLALTVCVLVTRDVILSFLLSLCLRFPGYVLLGVWAQRVSGWPWTECRPKLGRLGLSELRAARGPFALTLANALHYQGFVAISGLTIGPGAAVVVFAARTLVRLPTMAVNIVGAASTPSLVKAHAAGDVGEMRRLTLLLFAPVLGIAMVYLPVVLSVSDDLIRVWTNVPAAHLAGIRPIVALDCLAVCASTAAAYLLLATDRVSRTAAMALFGYAMLLVAMSVRILPTTESAMASLAFLNVLIAIGAMWRGASLLRERRN